MSKWKEASLNVTGKSSVSPDAVRAVLSKVGYPTQDLQSHVDEANRFARGKEALWEELWDSSAIPTSEKIRIMHYRSNGDALSYEGVISKKP